MGIIPDFLLDYISVNTYWTILFTIHALLAVALLGALSHQALSVLMPVRAGASVGPAGFVTRFRAVHGASYAAAVCVLWIVTFLFGAWIYTKYRMYVRIPIEQNGFGKRRVSSSSRSTTQRSVSDFCRSTGISGRTRATRNTTPRANG